jgi:hypothetical protein
MSRHTNPACVAAPLQRRPPVRVRSRRLDAGSAKLYPPDGQEKIWWGRLKKAKMTLAPVVVRWTKTNSPLVGGQGK